MGFFNLDLIVFDGDLLKRPIRHLTDMGMGTGIGMGMGMGMAANQTST